MPDRGKVVVAMSGGVDSSVAAAILRRDGWDVVGCFMRLGTPGEALDARDRPPSPAYSPSTPPSCPSATHGTTAIQGKVDPGARSGSEASGGERRVSLTVQHRGCCSVGDAADARLVAAELGIPLYVLNFRDDFSRIINYFADEYARGRTPNPCVRCNDWLKFGKLLEYARTLGADAVASGHYARLERDARDEPSLLRGLDHAKDQSYVLFGLASSVLGRMLLPVGGMAKPEVRDLARRLGLPVSDKPDSQEICFVPDDDYAGLVERLRPDLAAEGDLVDTGGRVVGRHRGHHRVTIGQRRGVGAVTGARTYVVAKDPATNRVTLGPPEALGVAACEVGEANWIADGWPPVEPLACLVQFRAHGEAIAARAHRLEDAAAATPSGRTGRFRVEFDTPARAVAAGQALVVYAAERPERVLGGGWIERAW
ncbi:MAG: tRNA 2-thiouridine(34) synthase MnmA [Phycisphaerae bacterium]|nr:tRNA 2-thiouridine(34) synthase MnmA [Phycisphaerae bacterium]